jgi:hypothetical protein
LYHTDADEGSTWVPDRGGLKAFTLFPLLRMPLTLHQLTSKETAVAERNVFYFWVDQQSRLELDRLSGLLYRPLGKTLIERGLTYTPILL